MEISDILEWHKQKELYVRMKFGEYFLPIFGFFSAAI